MEKDLYKEHRFHDKFEKSCSTCFSENLRLSSPHCLCHESPQEHNEEALKRLDYHLERRAHPERGYW